MPNFQKLDNIAIYSTDLQRLNTYGQNKLKEFVKDVNKELVNLNALIKKFNQENAPAEKIIILTQIYQEQIRIDDQYSPEYMAYCEDYRDQIHNNLFKEIKRQFKDLGIDTLPEKLPSDKLPKGASSSPLPTVLANMAPEKINKLLEILAEGKDFDRGELERLYKRSEKGYKEFKEFLSTHSINFLGGGNSKNFKIINNLTNDEFVLKVDNRLGMPKGAAAHLRENALKDVLTPVVAERQATYVDDKGKIATRTLMITEFCQGGDLESHGQNLKTQDTARVASALNIYTQMGAIVESIRSDGCAFPDMKNTNWLIDSDGTVRLADTKSFVFIENNGNIDTDSPKNKWYNFVTTRFMNPPEFAQDTPFSADKVHSYMLGKNLYQYLSNCDCEDFWREYAPDRWEVIHDAREFDYSAPIFSTPHGKELKKLILDMVLPNPKNRISVTQALSRLEKIQFSIEKENCTDLIKQIETLAKQISVKDSKLETSLKEAKQKIKSAGNLGDVLAIKKELEETAHELVSLKTERENCRQLLTDYETMASSADVSSKKIKRYVKDTLREINGASKLNDVLQIKNKLEGRVEEVEKLKTAKENCRQLVTTLEKLTTEVGNKSTETNGYIKKTLKEVNGPLKLNEILEIQTKLEERVNALEKLKEGKENCYQLIDEIEALETKTNKKLTRVQEQDIDRATDVNELSDIKNKLEDNVEELEELHQAKQECRKLLRKFKGDSVEPFVKKTLGQVLHAQETGELSQIKKNLEEIIKHREECGNALALFKGKHEGFSEARRFIQNMKPRIANIVDVATAQQIQEEITVRTQVVAAKVGVTADLYRFQHSFGANSKDYIKEKQTEINQANTPEQILHLETEIQEMSAAMEQYELKLIDMNECKLSSNGDNIDRIVQAQMNQMKQVTNLEQVQEAVRQLDNNLVLVKEDIKLKQVQDNCTEVLRDIEKYRFGPQDSKMTEFITQTQNAIKNATSEDEAVKLYQNLHNTLSTLKNDPSLKELREIIGSFRSNAHFYTFGMKEKAKGIEEAMGQVPIEKRKNIHIENDDTREVLKQLASNRKILGSSSTPLKKETTTEGVTKEVIDEKKAAQSFKDFKEKFKDIQPKQEAPEENETQTIRLNNN